MNNDIDACKHCDAPIELVDGEWYHAEGGGFACKIGNASGWVIGRTFAEPDSDA